MAIFRLQCAWALDSLLPRDKVMINPVFNANLGGGEVQALVDDLADALNTWDGQTTELTVKAYDVEGTPPVYPAATAVRSAGLMTSSGIPREVAVCLSFYAERNVPRRRGRLFIPAYFAAGSTVGLRPDTAARQKVAQLAPIFQDLGGADVDWSVWSGLDSTARAVTNWYVDDEWDTMRSRGLRATTRLTGTTSE